MTNKQLLDHANGNGNGNGKHNGSTTVKDYKPIYLPNPEPVTPKVVEFKASEQPVLIGRPGWWSHAFVWVIVGITASGITWACLAPIEQAVPAVGKLEAVGAARELRAPNGGVVREIFVTDGQRVKKGDLLLTFDPRAPQADLESLKKQRDTLLRENQFYNDAKNGNFASAPPEWRSLMESRNALLSENEFLKAQLSGSRTGGDRTGDFNINQERLSAASQAEIRSRVAAARLQVQELGTQLSQVQGLLESSRKQLPIQQAQLETARQRFLITREQLAAAQAQIPQAENQLRIAQAQLPEAEEQLRASAAQLETARMQLRIAQEQIPKAVARAETARQLLDTDQALYNKIKPVVDAGALSELQAQRQQQQILTRRSELAESEADILTRGQDVMARRGEIQNREREISAGKSNLLSRRREIAAAQSEIISRREQIAAVVAEISNRQGEVAARANELLRTQAEIDRLVKEQQRIQVAINRAQEQLQNTVALSAKDILTKIADNQKRVAEIDSQLARIRLENQKKLDEISSLLVKAEQGVEFQQLVSPIDGIVFDLKPNSPGYVVRSIDNEPVMKIVPADNLVAAVHLQNKDIGHVREGMEVDISVESFPSTEFGTVTGKLVSIGSDALPPTQERPFYAFPAKIEMERQTINVNGKEYNLQSGMAINANIKVRKRKVIDILLEQFKTSTDSLKNVR